MNRPCAAAVIILALLLPALAKDRPAFKRVQLTDQFWAEGAACADLNRDGKADVVYGPFWFEGPQFKKRHEYRPATTTFKKTNGGRDQVVPGFEGALGTNNAYSDNFFTWTHDFNGDQWPDILLVGMPGEPAYLFTNPRDIAGHWQRHAIFDVVDNESPAFLDLTGDGRPELICNSKGYFGYAAPDWADATRPWQFHAISPNNKYHRYTHGLGVGDLNGDGRMDLIEMNGWWEHPVSLVDDPVWKHHPFTFCPPTDPDVPVGGAQMFAYDVNGDGLNDVITALAAHGYGLAWWEQQRSDTEISFRRHLIINKQPEESRYGVAFSQLHAVELVDMNRDGLLDILTGKRFWAHGPAGDPDPNGPALLYWFELRRAGKDGAEFVPHLIDEDSGVGTQVSFARVNEDQRPDVVVGNKKGAFVFLQNQ
jgi:hypothetical protein